MRAPTDRCGYREAAPRPGGPSAKSFHRAGSPNHQDDSKETPMVEPQAAPTEPRRGG